MKKHLKDDKSNTFWSIESSQKSFSVTFGQMGTDGHTTTHDFDTKDMCIKEAEKLVSDKLTEGYDEVNWYILDVDDDSPYVSIIFKDLSPDNDLVFMLGKSNISIETPVTIFNDRQGKHYPDYFFGGHGNIISSKFLTVLKEADAKNVQAFSAVIRGGRDKEIMVAEGSYYVINVPTKIQCIDRSRSECSYMDKHMDKLFYVSTMFVEESKIPNDVHIFMPDWDGIFLVSKKLFELMDKAKLKGTRLLPWTLWTNITGYPGRYRKERCCSNSFGEPIRKIRVFKPLTKVDNLVRDLYRDFHGYGENEDQKDSLEPIRNAMQSGTSEVNNRILLEILSLKKVISHPQWANLVKEIIDSQPSFEKVAKEVYGQEVSLINDEGSLRQSWNAGKYSNSRALLRLLGNKKVVASLEWPDLVDHFISAASRFDLDFGEAKKFMLSKNVATHPEFAKLKVKFDELV